MTQHHDPDSQLIEKAWGRIHHTPWDQMNWFVRLANTDLHALSSGDLTNLRDEFLAMLTEEGGRYQRRLEAPSQEDMLEVQQEAKRIIGDIAHGRDTSTQPITVTYRVQFTKTSPEQEAAGKPRYYIYRGEVGEPSTLYGGPLREKLTELLDEYVNSIRACEHCEKLFLQVRSDARYCGRGCHSVAYMRKKRMEEKAAQGSEGRTQGKGRQNHDTRKRGARRSLKNK